MELFQELAEPYSQPVEDFETLTLVYKALDLKTRDHLTKR